MTTKEKVENYLKAIEKDDKQGKKINAFLELNKNAVEDARKIDLKILAGKAGKLAGLVIAVKANINVQGFKASCASKVLEDYTAPYDATAIEKLKKEDAVIIGMANMDEFACGASGETSAFGPTRNPINPELIPGGSSSGSAAAVAAGFCDVALGSDTGGSVRNPASHCGIVGVRPTYGLVSRYGLIDMAMSLDQIGVLGKSIEEVAKVLDVIKGRDERDAVSYESPEIKISSLEDKKITIGLLDIDIPDKLIRKIVDSRVHEIAQEHGFKVKVINMNYIDLAIQTYYPIVYTEMFSGTRKYDGRRYGRKIEDAAGPEVLRRILGGAEITKAEFAARYYFQALGVQQLIAKEFEKAFKDVDCIILPTVPSLPHKIGSEISTEEMYAYDTVTVPSSIAGNCAISIPCGEIDSIPVGMQIMCNRFQESLMFSIAKVFENSKSA